MKRLAAVLFVMSLFLGAACSGDSTSQRRDGGAFMFPDASFIDTGVIDTGVDAGPFVCNPGCPANEVCACLDDGVNGRCGCHAPQAVGSFCDPDVPLTCTSSTQCLRARRQGRDVSVCSNGAEGLPCSKTADICTTALGCVCLTAPTGSTDCRCTETFDFSSGLCDPMVAATCNDTCVRLENTRGAAYFVCSDGREGRRCEPTDGSCRTSLGCTCPIINGQPVCACTEPTMTDGTPCDPNVPGVCIAPLMCQMEGSFPDGISTICRGESMMMIPCDPLRPSCPPGTRCVGEQGMAFCVP